MPPRYQMLGRIGEGVHGVVVKARDLSNDDKIVAIKKLTLRTKHGWIAPCAIREIKVLQNSQCENVGRLVDFKTPKFKLFSTRFSPSSTCIRTCPECP